MADIYDQHDAAFRDVAAYLILDAEGDRAATIAFKYPKDGAGRLYAYVHWFGREMVRGTATGCGYDKHSAAVASAVRKGLLPLIPLGAKKGEPIWDFYSALATDSGLTWDRRLADAGFRVLQAV